MDAVFIKAQIDAAAARVQKVVDAEIAQLNAAVGPLAEIRVSSCWSRLNGVEFRAEFSSEYPEKPREWERDE